MTNRSPTPETGPRALASSIVLPFSKAVAALTKEEEKHSAGFDGVITNAYLHFPPGPNTLVDVRIVVEGRGGERYVVPSLADRFIALDNVTLPVNDINFPVEATDTIRVEWWNYDGANPHRVPVEVMVARVAKPERGRS